MTVEATHALIETYYRTFNAGDREAFLALLTETVAHDINQGGRETGTERFRAFLRRMDRCYREQIRDVTVMVDETGRRAAAEFTVHGTYVGTDEGLPEATGQHYILPAGAFFEIEGGQVARISNYYNLQDWLQQIQK